MRMRHIPRETGRFIRRALGVESIPDELAQLLSRLKPGDTFVDIGANVGRFSAHAAMRVGPTGRILAIEPNPALKTQLRKALAMPNAQIANVAVGPDHGTATLYIFKQHGRSSLLEKGRNNAYTLNDTNRGESAVVQVMPLLALLELYGITRVDALKIDVEGYEDRALLPFFDYAPEPMWPRLVLIERSPHVWGTDCLARLKEQGYEAVWEGRGDTLFGYRQGSYRGLGERLVAAVEKAP